MRMFLQLMAGLSFLVVLILGAILLYSDGPLLSFVQTGAAKKTVLSEQLQREEQVIEAKKSVLSEQLQREEELFQAKATFERYKRAKLQVAEEVIAGRLSLAEALEAFRELEGQRLPNITKQDLLRGWKMTEDDWLGQLGVLYYVEQVLADRPKEAAAVITRLNKELQELLASRQKRPAAPVEEPIESSR
jgi:hypothetical protein